MSDLCPEDYQDELEYCPGCDSWVDPTTCWCGASMSDHSETDDHSPVPMGCTCYSEKEPNGL